MKVLAIDVGSFAVKLCQAEVRKKEMKILNLTQIPLGDPNQGLDKQLPEVVSKIQEAVAQQRLVYDRLVLGLPATLCSFRFIGVPFVNRKKIDQVVPFEVEDLVPFSSEELIMDYEIVQRDKRNTELLVAMVPQVNYDNFISEFTSRGLEADIVMPDSVGLSIYCERFLPQADHTTVLIDIGHRHSSMTFLRLGNMVYIRPIPFGYASFTRHIQLKTGYSTSEVEALITQYDAFTPEQREQYHPILDEALTELVVEVNQTLIAYKSRSKESVGEILVSGGFGAFAYVIPTLRGEFSHPVVSVNERGGHPQLADVSELHRYATCIGYAAVYATESHEAHINFRRKETKAHKIIEKLRAQLATPITRRALQIMLILIAIGVPYLISKTIIVNLHFDRSEGQINDLLRQAVKANLTKNQREGYLQQPSKLLDFLTQDLEEGEAKISVFQKQQISVSQMLHKLQKAIPADLEMEVLNFQFEQTSVVFRAMVESADINAYVENLKKLSEVETVTVQPIGQGQSEIQMVLKKL
jgi:Tfp pilus assembly PilM family ATPase